MNVFGSAKGAGGWRLSHLVAGILLASTGLLQAQDVRINEFLASNSSIIADEDGDYEDWIELLNADEVPVNLAGWGLTDSLAAPYRWTFPDFTLAPGEFLVVFASGKDRTSTNPTIGIVREVFSGISGTTVASLTNHPSYPTAPSWTHVVTNLFEAPANSGDNYGQRMHALLVPPTTGNYRFWISSDDQSELRLSPDDNPAHVLRIAWVQGWTNPREWEKYSAQRSSWIALEANRPYYLAALMKDSSLSDHLAVRWEGPDGLAEAPMSASHFRASAGRFHANFKIAAEGEWLQLTRPDGTVADQVEPLALPNDVSRGRKPDAVGPWAYFAEPTPGQANATPPVELPPPVIISEPRGYKTAPFHVTLSSPDPEAVIRYTLDGREPDQNSNLYTGPVRIAATRFLRATAWQPGMYRPPPATATWIFLDDVLQQGATPPAGWPADGAVNGHRMEYGLSQTIVQGDAVRLRQGFTNAIPTLSIVTDLANLFDANDGVYVNPQAEDFERPVSVELLDPVRGAAQEFQIDAGLRLRGAHSRSSDNPKHSFRLLFRSRYGRSRLAFPLFGAEGTAEYEKVDLRTEQNHSWAWNNSDTNTFVREVFSRDTQRAMGQPYTRSRYYHLFLNGLYWGLYQTQERGDADFAASYLGGEDRDWDCIKTGYPGYVTEVADGNMEAFQALHQIALGEGFSGAQATNYWRARGLHPDGTRNPDLPVYLDEDNLIDYLLVTYFTGDPDSPVSDWGKFANNMYGLYRRTAPGGFQWLRHDAEHSLGAHGGYGVSWDPTGLGSGSDFLTLEKFNPATLHLRLMAHPEYRMRFADRVQRHLYNAGALTPENSQARIRARMAEIDLAIIAESARWGRGRTRDATWVPACQAVLTYLDQRREILLGHFRSRGWFPSLDAPQFARTRNRLRLFAAAPFYYLANGDDPRQSDGSLHPDAVWVENAPGTSASIPLIARGSVWRFFDEGGEPPVADGKTWRDPGYLDSLWSNGPAILGYAGAATANPVATPTRRYVSGSSGPQVTTTYLRHAFWLDSVEDAAGLAVEILRDDGAVVYLNGTEILRENMPAGPVSYATFASAVEGSPAQNTYFLRASDALHLLREGENVVAVEVHQCNDSSTDLYFDFSLAAEMDDHHSVWLPIRQPVTVKARTYAASEWSALTEVAVQPEATEGQDLHLWNFEDSTEYLAPSFTIGGGALTGHPGAATEFVRNAAAQDFATAHLRVNNPLGADLVFALPTAGFEDVALSFQTRRSGQGAGEQTLSYTVDGSNWIAFATYEIMDAAPQLQLFDFAELPQVANNPLFAVQVAFAQGAGGAAGNNRFDDVRLIGTPIPGTNQPPTVASPIGFQELVEGAADATCDLAAVFSDPDDDPLSFAAGSSDETVATVSVNGAALTVTPVGRGEATVTVSADDGAADPASTTFRLLVYPAAHVLQDAAFAFGTWSSNEPAGSFPAHMIFLQSDQNDPALDAALDRAYGIPPADAAVPADAEYPYAATSRTRLNGLGADGLGFINTGRGRDLGGALLALDTRDVPAAPISWLGGTLATNVRVYAIRMQYRVGAAGPFLDVLDQNSQPVEYVRNAAAGHTQALGAVELPAAALGQEYVQVLWSYYWVSGSSGARAQLRLDDIFVDRQALPPSGFAGWQQGEFSETELADPDVSGPLADPEGAGIENLLRYALGLGRYDDYREALPSGASTEEAPPAAVFRHRRLLAADSGIEYVLEYTDDLENGAWFEVVLGQDLTFRGAAPTGDGLTETVEYEVPAGTLPPPRHFRLRVRMAE